jgi:hypothetical protein
VSDGAVMAPGDENDKRRRDLARRSNICVEKGRDQGVNNTVYGHSALVTMIGMPLLGEGGAG